MLFVSDGDRGDGGQAHVIIRLVESLMVYTVAVETLDDGLKGRFVGDADDHQIWGIGASAEAGSHLVSGVVGLDELLGKQMSCLTNK